jgi:chromate transporter
MLYLKLFYSFLKIGLFGFGGGYAMLSLIQSEIVDKNGWLTNAEFTDIVAISQMTPGPIAINSATYVGYTATGNIWGSLLATLGVCLPAATLMMLITKFYLKLKDNPTIKNIMFGMRPMVVALIGSAAMILINPANFIDRISYIIFFVSLLLCTLTRVNPILIIVLSGIAGYLIY